MIGVHGVQLVAHDADENAEGSCCFRGSRWWRSKPQAGSLAVDDHISLEDDDYPVVEWLERGTRVRFTVENMIGMLLQGPEAA